MEERVACKAERIIIKRKNERGTCMKERGRAIRNDNERRVNLKNFREKRS